ncbi:MAG TPA: hypothetical protein VE075_11950, partial [Thermoanaerobaculia bacterium]|nr:hypothetical protein [Thermoanaerobaculia bacterium]
MTALAERLAALLGERRQASRTGDPGQAAASGGDSRAGGAETAGSGGQPAAPRVVLGGDTRESTAQICGW